MKSRISVAMTTYNGEQYLREQLESIYSQTRVPDEVIVVDDCSTDRTFTILEEYRRKYGLQYFINDKSLGVNRNVERAVRLCTGDYIALSDQDDVWMPHKIETCYQRLVAIENNLPSMVSSLHLDVDEDLNAIAVTKPVFNSDSYIATLLRHNSQGCSIMMNRSLTERIIPIPADKDIMFDLYIWLTAAMAGNKYFISEPLFYYRHHSSKVYGKLGNEKQSEHFLPCPMCLENLFN